MCRYRQCIFSAKTCFFVTDRTNHVYYFHFLFFILMRHQNTVYRPFLLLMQYLVRKDSACLWWLGARSGEYRRCGSNLKLNSNSQTQLEIIIGQQ